MNELNKHNHIFFIQAYVCTYISIYTYILDCTLNGLEKDAENLNNITILGTIYANIILF